MVDIVRELRDSADEWDACGPAYEGNSDMERRAADEIERLRAALRAVVDTPLRDDFSGSRNHHAKGWNDCARQIQALARKALGDE